MIEIDRRVRACVIVLAVVTGLLLSACAAGQPAAPTADVPALYTAAAETFIAELTRTAAAYTPTPEATTTAAIPTATPSATPTPEGTPTPAAQQTTPVCDNSAFVNDVTIPDGYDQLAPGQEFTKTWRVRNTGSCTWTSAYKLIFAYGDQLGGKATPLGVSVPPGESIDISVILVAPTASGRYTGAWRLSNASDYPFGEFLTVVITMK
jgi:hypothetical protein